MSTHEERWEVRAVNTPEEAERCNCSCGWVDPVWTLLREPVQYTGPGQYGSAIDTAADRFAAHVQASREVQP